jgi:hypothetical protein
MAGAIFASPLAAIRYCRNSRTSAQRAMRSNRHWHHHVRQEEQ